MNLVGELVIDRTRLTQIVGTLEGHNQVGDVAQDLGRASAHIGRVTTELQERIMRARMLPVENLFKKFPRMMRDLSIKAGKEMDFVIRGEETELDRSVIEEIGDPLMHLLRNAVDHAIESPEERVRAGKSARGTVFLEASQQENQIVVVVRDDGRGIDPEKIRNHAIRKGILTAESAKRLSEAEVIDLIFGAGFSTAEKVSDISGRGVGMDVVRKNIEKLNGIIEIDTRVGQGAEFRIRLPLTLAIIRALLVEVDREVLAIPLSSVTETHRIPLAEIQTVNRREVITLRGKVHPLLRLVDLLGFSIEGKESQDYVLVVIVNLGGKQVGIAVDSLVGEQEVVIKSLGGFLGEIPGLSGATILGDGNVAIILDVPSLVKAWVPSAPKTA
jgi:two-component system chemotaxis sensor kinase CheA